jgi:hypothetical protein
MLRVLVQGPLVSALAAILSVAVATLLTKALVFELPALAGRTLALVEAASTGVLYLACAAAILRFLAAGALREAIGLLPQRPRSLAMKVLRLA